LPLVQPSRPLSVTSVCSSPRLAPPWSQPQAKNSLSASVRPPWAQSGDQLEQLEAAIDRDGVSSTLRGGRIVANPLIAEHTKIATAISKLLETVAMDQGAPVDLGERRAAQARWKANRAAKSGGA
jgi:hypothetical protein